MVAMETITLSKLLPHGILAIFGAVVHALSSHRNGESKTFLDFISLVIMSSFAGIMFTLIALHLFPAATYLVYAMSGTGGFLGVEGMGYIVSYIKNKIK